MTRIVYEDEFITEYDDGTEEVRFTDAEWEQMLTDPRFGYVFSCGHRIPVDTHGQPGGDGTCWICEAEHEAEYYAMLDAEERAKG